MERVDLENCDLKEIAMRICSGEIFVYPTDTVYGLGCNAMDVEAVEKIFEIKGRDQKKPLSVAFADLPMLIDYVDVADTSQLQEKLPGAYTFIVKNKKIPKVVSGGLDTIGVRIPGHIRLLELINHAGVPIVTTSVNFSGQAPACSISDIPTELLEKVDFILEGECGSGKPSTVINLEDNKILR